MTESAKPKPKTGWLNILVDYGPLLVFLGVYKFYQPPETSTFGEIAAVIYGTIAFMIAAVAALVFSKFKFGHVSPMLILSTALIVGFGGLTIWLQDEKFIQIKPTAIYLLFGVLLIGGWLRGKACSRSCSKPLSKAWTAMGGSSYRAIGACSSYSWRA